MPKKTRKTRPAAVGFVIKKARRGYDYMLEIPCPGGRIWAFEGDIEDELFVVIAREAERLGISFRKALNRLWRDAFAKADCGD